MKKIHKIFLLGTLLLGAASAAAVLNAPKDTHAVEAAAEYPTTRSGTSGTVLFVNGAGFFPKDQYNLAICCWNGEEYAWSEADNYCTYGSLLRIVLPYKDGVSKTWANFKICRYELGKDPRVYGDAGVKASTDNLSFSSFMYYQNTVTITGVDGGHLYTSEMPMANYYYGIQSEEHMYLDLSGFTSWENDGAKFAIYFSYPIRNTGEGWSQANSTEGYYSSLCWKVNGQDNDHLYECIVPQLYGNNTIWNLAIAVRLDGNTETPNWNSKWNQSQDLHFNSDNQNANMIRVTDWGSAELDSANVIARSSRTEFYARYFINTVSCSGTGNSDATTNDMWNAVKYEYQHHLARLYQGDVWTAEADIEGTLLQQAMARYDYIVLYKQYAHEDFINRAESTTAATNNMLAKNEDFDYMTNVLVVIIAVSLASVILITLLKVKHRKQ